MTLVTADFGQSQRLDSRYDEYDVIVTGTRIKENAFRYCKKVRKITVLRSVKVIKEGAFRGCDKVSTIQIEGCTQIGKFAFEGCRNLRSVRLPDSLHEIAPFTFGNAFRGVDATVELPGRIILRDDAFRDCASLRTIVFRDVTLTANDVGYLKIESFFNQGCDRLEALNNLDVYFGRIRGNVAQVFVNAEVDVNTFSIPKVGAAFRGGFKSVRYGNFNFAELFFTESGETRPFCLEASDWIFDRAWNFFPLQKLRAFAAMEGDQRFVPAVLEFRNVHVEKAGFDVVSLTVADNVVEAREIEEGYTFVLGGERNRFGVAKLREVIGTLHAKAKTTAFVPVVLDLFGGGSHALVLEVSFQKGYSFRFLDNAEHPIGVCHRSAVAILRRIFRRLDEGKDFSASLAEKVKLTDDFDYDYVDVNFGVPEKYVFDERIESQPPGHCLTWTFLFCFFMIGEGRGVASLKKQLLKESLTEEACFDVAKRFFVFLQCGWENEHGRLAGRRTAAQILYSDRSFQLAMPVTIEESGRREVLTQRMHRNTFSARLVEGAAERVRSYIEPGKAEEALLAANEAVLRRERGVYSNGKQLFVAGSLIERIFTRITGKVYVKREVAAALVETAREYIRIAIQNGVKRLAPFDLDAVCADFRNRRYCEESVTGAALIVLWDSQPGAFV